MTEVTVVVHTDALHKSGVEVAFVREGGRKVLPTFTTESEQPKDLVSLAAERIKDLTGTDLGRQFFMAHWLPSNTAFERRIALFCEGRVLDKGSASVVYKPVAEVPSEIWRAIAEIR